MNRNNYIPFLSETKASFWTLLLGCLLLLCSCRSSSKVTTDLSGANADKARFEHLVKGSFKYEALQSKVKYSLGNTSLNGKLCLEAGKRVCMQVNAPILGFEVARVEAAKDAVLIVDKYDKIFTNLHLSELYQIEELSGHEVEALECIMLGRIYIPGRGPASVKDYSRLTWTTAQNVDGAAGNSKGTFLGKNYSLIYELDNKGQLVCTRLVVGQKSIVWAYADYQEVEAGKWVPTRESITAIQDDGKSVTASISMTNPSLGESSWRDFEPSPSYKEVSIQDLVTAVQAIGK